MRLLPKDKKGRIEFYERRLRAWAERTAEIGVPAERIEQLAEKVRAARACMNERDRLRRQSEGATARLDALIAEMMGLGSDVIKWVRAAPGGPGGNAAYVAACIDPPDKRAPLAPPGAPYNFNAALNAIGYVTLTWRCKQPRRGAQGTTYEVYRRIGADGPLEFAGAVGERRFEDRTIPVGSPSVTYEVRGIRPTGAGPFATHAVNLGAVTPKPGRRACTMDASFTPTRASQHHPDLTRPPGLSNRRRFGVTCARGRNVLHADRPAVAA